MQMMSSVSPLDNENEPQEEWDLNDPSIYLNRELTWLAFNRRVLAGAEDENTPLLERVKFLSIFDSNLDEFFMKRIGGLKQQLGAGVTTLTVDGRTPEEQLEQCRATIIDVIADRAFIKSELFDLLSKAGISVESYEDLDEESRKRVRKRYKSSVLPLVTPLAIDEAHPFPFISNLSINLLVEVHDPYEDTPHHVRIKVPTSDRTPRFMEIDEDRFVPLEEVIAGNLDLLFPGAAILETRSSNATRNSPTTCSR
jgi:polyphosphate kinase